MDEILDNKLLIIIVPPALTLIGVIVGTYLNYRWGINSQFRIGDRRERQQTVSKLMGSKVLIMQLYVSRFEALILSDYHEARWRLDGKTKDSIHDEQARRWMHKSEDLVLEVARSRQAMFEIIGTIRILFPKTDKLDELINQICEFANLQIKGDPFKMKPKELEAWRIKAVEHLQLFVETEYAKPMDALLDYLLTEIRKIDRKKIGIRDTIIFIWKKAANKIRPYWVKTIHQIRGGKK